MRGADTVNEEFEVGFNHRFESGWYRAEISISDEGAWLTFDKVGGQSNALVRLNLAPNALGPVPMEVTNGTDTVSWTVFVAP